jgi:hypothetical protein
MKTQDGGDREPTAEDNFFPVRQSTKGRSEVVEGRTKSRNKPHFGVLLPQIVICLT